MSRLKIEQSMIGYRSIFVLVFLSLVAFFIRFGDIDKPIYDAHAWRQTDTYSIAENFFEEGLNILKPRTNEISPITNKERIFLAEFPLYEYTLALFFKVFGLSVGLARLISIVITSITTLLVFYIGKNLFGLLTGFSSAIVFNLFPGSIFWGRSILSDVLALFLSTLAFALLSVKKKKLIFFAFVALGLAIVIKPFYLILLIPLIYLMNSIYKREEGEGTPKKLFLLIVSILPYLFWLLYTKSVPKSAANFHQEQQFFWGGKSAFDFLSTYRWLEILVNERLIEQFTPFLGILLIISMVSLCAKDSKSKFLYLWFGSAFLTFIIIAQGNMWHHYYQLIILPPSSLFIGRYVELFFSKTVRPLFNSKKFFILFFLMLAISFFAYYLWYIPKLNNIYYRPDVKFELFEKDIIKIKGAIKINAPVLIVDDLEGGSPTLLNHFNYNGWIVKSEDFCNMNKTLSLIQKYKLLGANILIFPLEPYYFLNDLCNREEVISIIRKNFAKLYIGQYISVFNLN